LVGAGNCLLTAFVAVIGKNNIFITIRRHSIFGTVAKPKDKHIRKQSE